MKQFRRLLILLICICMLAGCSGSGKTPYDKKMREASEYVAEGKWNKAIDAFTVVITNNQTSAGAYAGRGDAYAGAGKYSQAEKDYSNAILLQEKEPSYYLKRAVVYYMMGKDADAEKDLQAASQLSDTFSSSMVNRISRYITSVNAGEKAEAVLKFLGAETAAVPTPTPAESAKADNTPTPAATPKSDSTPTSTPASETPKTDSTPIPTPTPASTATPTPSSSSGTKPADFKGTLADIKNLDELLDCIDNLMTPIYMEENFMGGSVTMEPYDYGDLYAKVKKYKSIDEYRNHYKQFMTDNAENVLLGVGYKFAMHNGGLYFASAQFGWGSVSKQDVKLKEIDKNGDYHISVPIVFGPTLEDAEYYDFALRYVDGKFKISKYLTVEAEPFIGYLVVNTKHLNIRTGPGTSSEKKGRFNNGALLDVYEIRKDSKYTWYRISRKLTSEDKKMGMTNSWIADNGSWVTYVPYK